MYDGTDRTQQVNALHELAENIFCSLPENLGPSDLDPEAVRLWYMPEEMPAWFDERDMELLLQMVRREVGKGD